MSELNGLGDKIRSEIGKLNGWLTPDRAVELAEFVIDRNIETAVCLGVFAGRSVMALAMAMKQKGSGKVYGIDPWKVSDAIEGENDANKDWWTNRVDLHLMHRETMEMIWKHDLDDHVLIIRAASHRVPRLFPGGIELLEIDGNHSESASCRDVNLYAPQLNENAIVIMDDCDWPSTQKAQELILNWCKEIRGSPDGHYKIFERQLRVDTALQLS